MVFAVKPVMLLVKLPVPEPFVVLLLLVVGFAEVLQHTPRPETLAPPSLVIMPPLVAVVCVIEDTAVVVRTGIVAGFVVKLT